jgi:predicted O-methyltransferase YrrM
MINYILAVFAFGVIGFFIGKFVKHKSLYPFMPYRYDFRKRRNTFLKTLELLDEVEAKVIIETGTSREGLHGAKSNGAATIVFGKWAKLNNAHVHSVDISEESVKNALKEVKAQGLENQVTIYLSDSIAFLKGFNGKVDFLYLDSYDYSNDPLVQVKCQLHHLEEFKAIENRLHKKSIVLIDDCDLPNGGKGKMVVEYMLSKDWIILMKAYQILLARRDLV